MNWAALIPALASLLESLASGTVLPKSPIPPSPSDPTQARADQAIKHLQAVLNALGEEPPLVVDGWLGPKTDVAIEAGLAKLKAATGLKLK